MYRKEETISSLKVKFSGANNCNLTVLEGSTFNRDHRDKKLFVYSSLFVTAFIEIKNYFSLTQ